MQSTVTILRVFPRIFCASRVDSLLAMDASVKVVWALRAGLESVLQHRLMWVMLFTDA